MTTTKSGYPGNAAFLHRLVNDLDIKAIERAVSYLDRVSYESLPTLPTGVCILAGVAAQIPVMVKVGQLAAEFEPNSRTMSIVESWTGSGNATPASTQIAAPLPDF